MRIVAVIQARTGSSRLPGKVLLPLGGRSVLERMIERVRAARQLDAVVVATTILPTDDPIRVLAAEMGVTCVSGDPTDLLDRHLAAARATAAEAVVKIPSDCPLIDPRVIDEVVGFYRSREGRLAFVSNLHPPTWPDGNDVEVMSLEVLETAWCEATQGFEREHTTPFIWDHPERFPIANVTAPWDLSASHRLTLDYQEDYQVIAAVFGALYRPGAPPFTVEEIVAFLDAHPEVRAVNERHLGQSWMSRHLHELRTMQPAPAPAPASVAPAPTATGTAMREDRA
ncbi:MAG TPA: glycosyltransferase family protein [Dongiaceae bacterium]|nr:glycosyltransferase family protein [Dongiaceae bacterium]